MQSRRHSIFIAVWLVVALPGCAFTTPNSIRRIWCDHNTLQAPAIYLEKADHLPYHQEDVEHYRWMYNMGPIVPLAPLPEPGSQAGHTSKCDLRSDRRVPDACRSQCLPTPAEPMQPIEQRAPVLLPSPELPQPQEFAPPPAPADPPGIPTDAPTAGGAQSIQLASGREEATRKHSRTAPVMPPGGWLFGR